jgi:hypothetical protein
MKVIATNEESVIVNAKDGWAVVNAYTGQKYRISSKGKDKLWYVAAQAKWGYVPLKEGIAIKGIGEVDEALLRRAIALMQWKKDYVN